jgi:trehalose 6-phosphate synthase/phosphatase
LVSLAMNYNMIPLLCPQVEDPRLTMILDTTLQNELINKYKKAGNRLILLDYDGTLVTYRPNPEQALPSESLLDILNRLAGQKETDLIIISGRDHPDIDSLLGDLPINIIAGHGAIMKEKGLWKNQVPDDIKWKDTIRPILAGMSQQCPESIIEDKHFSLAWHYRNTDRKSGFEYSRQLIRNLEKFSDRLGLKILDGNMVVEIMRKEIGKGIAVGRLLAKGKYDFILSIGDDVTDEEIFALFIPEKEAVTIKVGNGATNAKYCFSSVEEVVLLLKHLSE